MSLNTPIPTRALASAGFSTVQTLATAETLYAGSGAERLLMDAAERALRAPRGKMAMALHLSRLRQPAPRPYHTRIALALMQDTARRLGGQVFPMRNADLVLLCATPGDEDGGVTDPLLSFTLPDALERLFGVDAPDAALTSIWRLDETPAEFRDYILQRQAEPPAKDHAAEEVTSSGGLASLVARVHATDLRQLLTQQTAVTLRPGRGVPLSARIAPFFREFMFNPAALPAGGPANLLADPFIMRHLTGTLDARILALLHDDLEHEGPLTRPALRLGVPIHLNLAAETIVSPDFARLVGAAALRGARLAVELAAMDTVADPVLAAFAGALLRQADIALVLDGIDHAALPMLHPRSAATSLVKVAWSLRMADGPAAAVARIDAAIDSIGAGRVVLQDADCEAALIWGQAHGITHYQGPYIDAVQAASRIAVCHGARACSLRQCNSRGRSMSASARSGCSNPGLLDMTPFSIAVTGAGSAA
jgi:hypothetical protein